jgi:hypothetical protein
MDQSAEQRSVKGEARTLMRFLHLLSQRGIRKSAVSGKSNLIDFDL